MTSKSFSEINDEMLKRFLDINPDLATEVGMHDPYDDLMPHGGAKRFTDALELLEEWKGEASEATRSKHLSVDERLGLEELDLATSILRFSIEDYPVWKMYPDALDIPGALLFIMLTREYAPFDRRATSMASRLKKMPDFLEQFRTRFEGTRSVLVWTDMAIESCEHFPAFLDFLHSYSKDKLSPDALKELSRGIECTKEAIREQKDWLIHKRDGALMNFPMGRKRFAKLIKLRRLGLTPGEMLALGERYLAKFKEERTRIAEKIAPGKGVEGAKAKVVANAPRTFEEALEATRREMDRAREFIVEKDLATVDGGSKLIVTETPRFMAPVVPYAALFMPSLFDARQEGEYIVTRPRDPKDLGSHLNYASIVNTAVHEAYPGHFHQGVMSNKKPWILQLPMGVSSGEAVYIAAETVEGWAHYCEKMMFDHGFGASDQEQFEMLNGAIWRACRIIADIKLAHGEATIEEMTEFMIRETGMPRDATADEVKRYSHQPGQALSYLIGRHLLLQLRESLEQRMGDRFDEKRFHDLVASYGCLQFSMMKEAVESHMIP